MIIPASESLRRHRLPAPLVIALVARGFALAPELLTGPGRTPGLVLARHSLFWLLRQQNRSYPAIGRLVHRDHSTVMYGVGRIAAKRQVNPRLNEHLKDLLAKMGGVL